MTAVKQSGNGAGSGGAPSDRLIVFLTIGGLLSFFAFGFIDNLKGALLPELLRAEQLDYGEGGRLLLAAYMGFVVATLVAGVVADTVGNRRVLLAAGWLLLVGLFGLAIVSSLPALAAMMFLVGLGLGAIEVGGNGLMLELHARAPGRYLNLLATFHGIGSLLVPLYVAWLLSFGASWEIVYASSLGLAMPLVVIFFRSSKFRSESVPVASPKHLGFTWLLEAGFSAKMLCYYFLLAAYVAAELGVAAWLVEYMQVVEQLGIASSSIALSAFFALIMVGRLLGAWLVDRIAYLPAIGLALLGGVICLLVGITGHLGIFFLPLSGLFFSIVFPTVTAHVLSMHVEGRGTIMGILFTFGGIGGALGPWLIGQIALVAGLRAGLSMTAVFAGVSLLLLLVVSYNRKRQH